MNGSEALEFAELLRKNPVLETHFLLLVTTERLLPLAIQASTSNVFADETIERIRFEKDLQGSSKFLEKTLERIPQFSGFRKKTLRIAIPLAAAAAAVAAGLWLTTPSPSAHLIHGTSARWEGSPPNEKLAPGTRLKLAGGIAKLQFKGGARVILEGPADFEITSENQGKLISGRASAMVSESSRPLLLDSSFGTVSQPGSFFGITAAMDGSGELQNFSREITAHMPDGMKTLSIGKNETLRFIGGIARKISGTQRDTFVTSVPPPPVHKPHRISWNFDADPSYSSGNLASGTVSTLESLTPGGRKPMAIPGPFSPALSFDGIGSAIGTDFRGLGGGVARTVAFWIRLPTDFSPEQGYGIISWGDLREPGTAWQISANPEPEEGELACLRIGVGNSSVVGNTKLDDANWHHCAIVFYGGETPSVNTPVFLYIDGIPEVTERKLVHAVRTNTSLSARPVWIGRSLGQDSPERPEPFGTGFFRGDLDEIHIFDSALSLHEINQLMLNNPPKTD